MKRMKTRNLLLGILSLFVLVLLFMVIALFGKSGKNQQVTIGFVMSGSIDEDGWNGMHYQGIRAVCEEFDAKLLVKEEVKEFSGACKQAIKELAEEGAGMIILGSYGYAQEVCDLVSDYPEINFYVNSSEYHETNMTSYFARMYQARYLAGILAGMQTESDRIGYVAAMPNYEVNRGINAFTLGVKRVNPEANVVVSFSGMWDDEAAEKAAAQALIDEEGADVLTYHQNKNHVIRVAEAAGISSIGYHKPFEEFSDGYLTSVICDWQPVYRELVREYLRGNANIRQNYWIGIETGAVGLSPYSPKVTEEMKAEIQKAIKEMFDGKDVFAGRIYDNEGNLRCDENEIISDEMLLEQFDWYVEGVEFHE